MLATEAFDLAGDPSVFPEQVAGPSKRLEPLLENLRPWQPKKIYYFPDADREDIFRGKGPEYSVKEISKSGKQAYWRMALDSFRAHQTQAKSFLDKLAQMDESQIEKMATSDSFWTEALHFVLGKSLVGGSTTGDIFEDITAGAIAFARPDVSAEPARPDDFTTRRNRIAAFPTASFPERNQTNPATSVAPRLAARHDAAAPTGGGGPCLAGSPDRCLPGARQRGLSVGKKRFIIGGLATGVVALAVLPADRLDRQRTW